MSILSVWLIFAALALTIGVAGYFLSVHADQIAEKTGLGKNLMGMILLATITSLPELMTGISSVTLTKNPNLAIGDILGSCVFNLSLVFLLDLFYRRGSIYSEATKGHILTSTLGGVLIATTGFFLALNQVQQMPVIFHVGLFSIVTPVIYLYAMKFNYDYEMKIASVHERSAPKKDTTGLKKNILWFSISAVIIIAAGSSLPFIGEEIMHVMSWESAFVGTIFMALATSLPEIAVTLSALRLKAAEMAFSNLLGSNLFNIIILAIDDFFYTPGPILAAADESHLLTVFSALLMTGVATLGLIYPPEKKIFNTTSLISLVIFFLFILNVYVMFLS